MLEALNYHILKVLNTISTACGNFIKFTTLVQLGTDELTRFWGQKLSSKSQQDCWRRFLTYLWNAWSCFNETCHG